ncbi:hypothetical protein [Caudoviricetes sp.]|nr:hypothetical protein [Caudoviricetes sp.]
MGTVIFAILYCIFSYVLFWCVALCSATTARESFWNTFFGFFVLFSFINLVASLGFVGYAALTEVLGVLL